MAEKALKPKEAERRAKIQAARVAQQKAEKRKRTMIIALSVVVVLAIVAAVAAVVIIGQKESNKSTEVNGAIPTAYADGEPIIISDQGVGVRNPDLEDLKIYYSYSCHACAYLDAHGGPFIIKAAEEGAYNLLLIPVANVDYPWRQPATNAALRVAAEDPEHFVAFHQALSEYFDNQYNTLQDDTVLADMTLSTEKVAEIAQEAGVSADVISEFGNNADAYTNITDEQWRTDDIDRLGTNSGTPELVYNGTKVMWTPTPDGQAILDEILKQMTDLGWKDPR